MYGSCYNKFSRVFYLLLTHFIHYIYDISVDSDLEMDTRQIKVLICKIGIQELIKVLF